MQIVIAAEHDEGESRGRFMAALIPEKETTRIMVMDLSNFSLPELRALQESVKQEIKTRDAQEIAKAREQIMAIAQSVGMPLKELLNNKGKKTVSQSSSLARYQSPDDPSRQWSGRGRRPKWAEEAAQAGTLEQLRIK